MINRHFILSALVLSLIIAPTLALAESDDLATSTGNRFRDIQQEYRDKVMEIRQNFREDKSELQEKAMETRRESRDDIKNASTTEDRDQLREERRTKLMELRDERIGLTVQKVTERLQAALDRLNRFIERVEAILQNREDNGNPVPNATEVQAKLDEAKTLISDTQPLINALPAKIADLTASTTNPAVYPEIRSAVEEITGKLKEVHAKIVEAVRLIKANQ